MTKPRNTTSRLAGPVHSLWPMPTTSGIWSAPGSRRSPFVAATCVSRAATTSLRPLSSRWTSVRPEILRLQGQRAAHLHEAIRQAIRDGMAEFAGPEGVMAPASTWIVSARAQAVTVPTASTDDSPSRSAARATRRLQPDLVCSTAVDQSRRPWTARAGRPLRRDPESSRCESAAPNWTAPRPIAGCNTGTSVTAAPRGPATLTSAPPHENVHGGHRTKGVEAWQGFSCKGVVHQEGAKGVQSAGGSKQMMRANRPMFLKGSRELLTSHSARPDECRVAAPRYPERRKRCRSP